jgi:uncharacterized protein (DUF2249 family)/CRP-like cAMP-binding protein
VIIDVRTIPTWQRHPRIFAAFDKLAEGDELQLRTDHEPRPLRVQFGEQRSGQYLWIQRMLGNGDWQVQIRRISAGGAADRCIEDELARLAVFADASEATLHSLAAIATVKVLRKRQALVEQGAAWPHLGVVLAGTLQALVTTPLGREQALYDIIGGEPFGHTWLLDGGVAIARFVAPSKGVRIAVFPADAVRAAADRDPGFARALAVASAQTTRSIAERFAAHLSQPTVSRVAAALLPYAAPEAGLTPALAGLRGLSQSQLAASAGTVKEVVNRALAELERERAIVRAEGHVVRLDRSLLTEIANR